jgi:hypothetical protein
MGQLNSSSLLPGVHKRSPQNGVFGPPPVPTEPTGGQ